MVLQKIRKIKTWSYLYDSKEEKEEHMICMLAAKFSIEKETELSVEYGQTIKEIE